MKNRNYNGLIKLTAAVLTASIALTACAAPGTEGINSSIAADIITSEGQETASDSPTAGQAADYLMQAAGNTGGPRSGPTFWQDFRKRRQSHGYSYWYWQAAHLENCLLLKAPLS